MIQTDLGSLILIQITPEERTLYCTALISEDGFFGPKLKSSEIFASQVMYPENDMNKLGNRPQLRKHWIRRQEWESREGEMRARCF